MDHVLPINPGDILEFRDGLGNKFPGTKMLMVTQVIDNSSSGNISIRGIPEGYSLEIPCYLNLANIGHSLPIRHLGNSGLSGKILAIAKQKPSKSDDNPFFSDDNPFFKD